MRVAIPHMGHTYVPFKALFQRLGIEYVIPPANTQRTMSLAVRHSPEGLCIPFKLTLGNMIEAAEMGADTILAPGGYGICRLGYYVRIQQQVLRELGYNTEIVELGVSEQKFLGFLKMIKHLSGNAPWIRIISAFRFGMAKLYALDNIERAVQKVRAVEAVKGSANRIFSRALAAIDHADDHQTIRQVKEEYVSELNAVARNGTNPLVVGITGEFYVVLEPFSNMDVESELGKLGVEVRRETFVSEWTKFSFFLNPLGVNEKERSHRAAMPYLKRDIGGDGWESVGDKVLHSGEYDGLIHLAPFTCMPEIVAENIMMRTKEDLPVLTILCDEQLAKAGMLTRLEAFVDLLERRRRAGKTVKT